MFPNLNIKEDCMFESICNTISSQQCRDHIRYKINRVEDTNVDRTTKKSSPTPLFSPLLSHRFPWYAFCLTYPSLTKRYVKASNLNSKCELNCLLKHDSITHHNNIQHLCFLYSTQLGHQLFSRHSFTSIFSIYLHQKWVSVCEWKTDHTQSERIPFIKHSYTNLYLPPIATDPENVQIALLFSFLPPLNIDITLPRSVHQWFHDLFFYHFHWHCYVASFSPVSHLQDCARESAIRSWVNYCSHPHYYYQYWCHCATVR